MCPWRALRALASAFAARAPPPSLAPPRAAPPWRAPSRWHPRGTRRRQRRCGRATALRQSRRGRPSASSPEAQARRRASAAQAADRPRRARGEHAPARSPSLQHELGSRAGCGCSVTWRPDVRSCATNPPAAGPPVGMSSSLTWQQQTVPPSSSHEHALSRATRSAQPSPRRWRRCRPRRAPRHWHKAWRKTPR